jgi:electron transfer flavoprotein beta subunit
VRDAQGGEVTVVTVGGEDAEKELRTALAMGADKAVLINIEDDVEDGDQYTTAKILSEYLKEQEADLIIGGNVAIDGGSGQVGPRVAGLLDIPYVTTVTKLEIDGENVTVTRDVEGDSEIIETSLPLLITAQQGLNEPRYPSLPGIMKAKKKPLEELELDDLDLEEDDVEAKTKSIEIYLPPQKEAGKVLQGEVPNQVKELVQLLRSEAKVI